MTKTKSVKKKGWTKCFICTHSYKTEEVDEHMNGITHHHVLEELYKKSRPHHCIVCGCVWNGLALYRQHVGTAEHKKKVLDLVKKRRSGTHVPLKYTTPPDLITLCKERERVSNENKAKRKQVKLLARKAKQEARHGQPNTTQHQQQQQQQHPYPHHQQNKENKNRSKRGSMDNELCGHSLSHISASSSNSMEWDSHTVHQDMSSSQAGGSKGCVPSFVCASEGRGSHSTTGVQEQRGCVVQSSGSGHRPSPSPFFPEINEIDFSQDFTSDLLPPVGAVLFAQSPSAKEGQSKGKQQKEANHNGALSKETAGNKQKKSPHGKKSRKRSQNSSEGPPRSSSEQNEVDDPPRAPGLVKAHVKHISTILRRIRKSLDEEGLANLPAPSTSTAEDEHYGAPKKLKTAHDEDGPKDHEEGTRGGEEDETTHSDSMEVPQPSCSTGAGTSAADPSPVSQSRRGLPELLKRDLNRLNAKSGTHREPNLTAARRVRTISSSLASAGGETEKETAPVGPGLRPTLQKLINSAAAKRKVNWKELYQEYRRKKRVREKGMPRFGIELVSPVVPLPDDLQLEELQDLPLGEDFQWDSIDFESTGSPACGDDPASEEPDPEEPAPSAGQAGEETWQDSPMEVCVKKEKDTWGHSDLQDIQSPTESTSQANEGHPGPQQAKPKKERQVDELLAVSLREEELSSSLLNLEDNLSQARTALQDAYVKVQHLLVVREQTANDISALRAKRIEILKVMRGGGSSSGDGEKQRARPSQEVLAQPATSSQPSVSVSPSPPPDPPPAPAQPAVPSAGLEDSVQALGTITIKEEPVSPTFAPGSL